MKLSKIICVGMLCGATLFTAACSDSDSNAKIVYQQSLGLCNAISCTSTEPMDCLQVAENLKTYIDDNKDALADAFTDWKGFDWADLVYGPVGALYLYKTQQAVNNCDAAGIEANKTQAFNAFNALTTFDGFTAAMDAAAAKCASGGCDNNNATNQ